MATKMVFVPPHSGPIPGWLERLRSQFTAVEFASPQGANEVVSALYEADAAFGTLTPALIAAAPQLRWLQAPAAAPPAGFYFDELMTHPVQVTNFRGIYNDHISYHILGMMLSFAKHFHLYRDQQNRREWQPLSGPGYNEIFLPESTLLIVGAGGIGIETARVCKAIGMRVIATDARRTEPCEWLDELHPTDALDDLLPLADFVVTTIPHTPESEGMFDARVFGLMKRSAIFINIGRGMTTRLDDLNAALRGGVIAGAGLDVYEIEPLPTSHPLWDAPNTLLTPHTAVKGGAHLDERRYAIIENNVRRFLEGAPLVNVVDKAQWF
ncbi:MAG: D-2-hydroxyacid dehydrogenase [Chromatiales bacterium]|jgi:phosphoglycerate dehydrogenase-like enzyme|nr:D-2-hydroxyacid dehydrogenase [Chromatiales bacterium]